MQPSGGTVRLVAAAVLIAAAAAASAGQTGALVALRIQPRVGDTLRTRFEQDATMSGTTKVKGVDTTLVSKVSLLVLARVAVQASDAAGCTLLVLIDSVAMLSVESQAISPSESARRAMQGQEVTLRLKSDGSAALVTAPKGVDQGLVTLISTMPAVLPASPVRVGGSWENTVSIPVGGDAEPGHGARLKSEYRLDSLGAGGDRAYIGIRGLLKRDSAEAPIKSGARVATTGTLRGTLVLDRARGWWASSQITIVIRSTVTPAASNPGPSVRVQTRMTQRMETQEARGGAPPPG
jgi:hypothetical protein